MAGRTVTNEDIIKMNELYVEHKTYAAVSRLVGFSATTVKKYIIPDYASKKDVEIKHFTIDDLPQFYPKQFIGRSWEELLKVREEEKTELVEFWKELKI